MKHNTQLFTKDSLSDYLSISTSKIDKDRRNGALRSVKIGTRVRFTKEHVEEYLKNYEI